MSPVIVISHLSTLQVILSSLAPFNQFHPPTAPPSLPCLAMPSPLAGLLRLSQSAPAFSHAPSALCLRLGLVLLPPSTRPYLSYRPGAAMHASARARAWREQILYEYFLGSDADAKGRSFWVRLCKTRVHSACSLRV